METEFKSQICTTVEQSDRLLDLGLKPETADMHYLRAGYWHLSLEPWEHAVDDYPFDFHSEEEQEDWKLRHRPAWSLHRLIEMMPQSIYHKSLACFLFIDQSVYVQYRHSLYGASQTIVEQFMKSNLWENLINCIEWLIEKGYFPKRYLV